MINRIRSKSNLGNYIQNIPGYRTRRRFLVIESDDWGSIRMPSLETYRLLERKGYPVDTDPYMMYDSLAGEEDLTNLFDVLSSVRDMNGNHAVLTANTIMGNPDYDRIESSGFNQFYLERFTQTLQRYPNCQNSFQLWEQGMNGGLFKPQYHGREHVNVARWLEALRRGEKRIKEAFNQRMLSICANVAGDPVSYFAALNFNSEQDMLSSESSLQEGIDIFHEIFQFKPESFIATSYVWHAFHEKVLAESGVRYLQGIPYQFSPVLNKKRKEFHRVYHFTGQGNRHQQLYIVRNAHFEPSIVGAGPAIVEDCLRRVQIAFSCGKPAVISSHRLNFIGSIQKANREANLKLLKQLLEGVLKHWPDVEFVSTDQLGREIWRF